MKIKLLLLAFLFFGISGIAQNSISYSSLNVTLNLNSGVEGTSNIVVSCFGSSGTPVVLNTFFLCGNPDGYISYEATNGHALTPGQTTTLKFKFKKTVTTDTQIVYKFSTNGSCFQNESEMIKITVNYKAAVDPTAPIDPTASNNIYLQYAEQNITYVEKQNQITVLGSYLPAYTYEWQSRIGSSPWTTLPNEVGQVFNLLSPSTSISLKRIVRNAYGAFMSESNIINITVYPKLENNSISISGSYVEGTKPIGGTGYYDYKWFAYLVEGEGSTIIEGDSEDLIVPKSLYNWADNNNVYIERMATSAAGTHGEQTSISNVVRVFPAQQIQNNVITLSGSNVIGSLPNGGTGSFKYEYFLYQEFDGEILEVYDVGNEQHFTLAPSYGGLITKIYRKVTSGNKVSISNTITVPVAGISAKNPMQNNLGAIFADFIVYPNPTSESINFATNFTTDKNIEIVLYSEKIGNEKSVYKGKVTPNQVVNWKIPTNYQKGLYFYKIFSDNTEVKSGKVIFN